MSILGMRGPYSTDGEIHGRVGLLFDPEWRRVREGPDSVAMSAGIQAEDDGGAIGVFGVGPGTVGLIESQSLDRALCADAQTLSASVVLIRPWLGLQDPHIPRLASFVEMKFHEHPALFTESPRSWRIAVRGWRERSREPWRACAAGQKAEQRKLSGPATQSSRVRPRPRAACVLRRLRRAGTPRPPALAFSPVRRPCCGA